MKTKLLIPIVTSLVIASFLIVTPAKSDNTNKFNPATATATRRAMGVKPIAANEVESEAALWRDINQKLFNGRVVADAAKASALLRIVDRGDCESVRRILLSGLDADLKACSLETNYPFSDEEKKALALARDYLNQAKEKK